MYFFRRHSSAFDGVNSGVSSGLSLGKQMVHMKWKNIWKTAAPPGLLVYVHRRLSDLQSWLSSGKKRGWGVGKRYIPGKKKKCSLL